MRRRYDYLVVGGGSAGCVTATRLAEAGHRVGLFEAGPSDRPLPVVQWVRRWPELIESGLDYAYRIEAGARDNPRLVHSRGRVLGGCSSHNSCIALRPSPGDFDTWPPGWRQPDVSPAFERVYERVRTSLGATGNPVSRAFIDAAQTAGHAYRDFTREVAPGVGWLPLNVCDGRRESAANAYVHRSSAQHLDVVTDATVVEVLLDGRRARAVRLITGDVIEAEGEIVVAAGVFDSPKLLMLSGIGPAGSLDALGIPVQVDNPDVGAHLLDHPEGVLIFALTRPLPRETVQKYEVGVLADADRDGRAELMIHLGLEAFDLHTRAAGYPTRSDAISLTPNVAYAGSEGRVRLRAADPREAPRIEPRYFSDPDDLDTMLRGFDVAREIVAETPLCDWIERELAPGDAVRSAAELTDYLSRTHNTVYHPAGTCRLGDVVDTQLAVRGITGLRVADASVFPALVGVNPNMTVMMIGERCAAFMLE